MRPAVTIAAAVLLQACGGDFDPPPPAQAPPLPSNAAPVTASQFDFAGMPRRILPLVEISLHTMQLLSDAAGRLQRHRPFVGPIDYFCANDGGIRLRAFDTDRNDSITVGDSIIIEYIACEGRTGSITLQVANAIIDGQEVTFLEGEVDSRLAAGSGGIRAAGSLQFQVIPPERRWLGTEWTARTDFLAPNDQIENARIDKILSSADGRYVVQCMGIYELGTGAFVFETAPAFGGTEEHWPDAGGRLLIHGRDASRAAIRARGTDYIGWRVDEDGDGIFDAPEKRDTWRFYSEGSLFGIEGPRLLPPLPPEP